MKKNYQNKQITSESKGVKNKTKASGKNVFNFPPMLDAPAMSIEAKNAREAEEIYQKKIATLIK
jgi:hypothetical protein